MNRPPIHCCLTGLICAGLAGLLLIQPARGGGAYLRVVGPPALRFQTVTTNYFVFDPGLFKPVSLLAETVSNAVNQLAAPTTNVATVAAEPPMPVAITNPQPVIISTGTAAGEQNTPNGGYNFTFPASTASDLLTVTPQMVAEYLKPQAGGTNRFDHPGTAVFVPVQMPFLPPAATGTAESRATYESK